MTERHKILFVDDEENVLSAFRRSLRCMRDQWDMHFANGGAPALEKLHQDRFDAIVTDMRMPGMEGDELLEQVREHWPNMVRIALSGQTDKELTLRQSGPVHQFLTKPCSPEVLTNVVNRLLELKRLVKSDAVQAAVARMESLPTLSDVYHSLMEEIESPQASLSKISDIMSHDIGLITKIMKLVNSAFIGIPQEVASIEQAVMLLGLDTIKAIAMSTHIFECFDANLPDDFNLNQLWKHSMSVGLLAQALMKRLEITTPDRDYALLAGLLHDTGKLIIASELPGAYQQIQELAGTRLQQWQAEQQVLQCTHGELGAFLLGLWGFNDRLIDVLTWHHRPSQASQAGPLLTAIHISDLIVHESEDQVNHFHPSSADADYLRTIGLENRLDEFRELAETLRNEGMMVQEVNSDA